MRCFFSSPASPLCDAYLVLRPRARGLLIRCELCHSHASTAYQRPCPSWRQPSLPWFQAHRLFVFNSDTRRTAEVGGVDGVSAPTWSSSGKDILYVNDNALWLSPALGGKAIELETPLFPPAQWEDVLSSELSFYGQVTRTDQFSWRSR